MMADLEFGGLMAIQIILIVLFIPYKFCIEMVQLFLNLLYFYNLKIERHS
jgi:hypothetical protein